MRAALASDRVLANPRGIEATIKAGFYSASMSREGRPELRGQRTVGKRVFDVRTDGALLCQECNEERAWQDRAPVEVLAGEFGRNIQARCSNPTCPWGRRSTKVSLRGTDRNQHLPGSTISRGAWNPRAISMLPVWSDEYIAKRFLALQRVEWVHAQFERLYGLGSKNPGFDRRLVSGTHANTVWWTLATLVWNITLALNLNEDRATILEVRRERDLPRTDVRARVEPEHPTLEHVVPGTSGPRTAKSAPSRRRSASTRLNATASATRDESAAARQCQREARPREVVRMPDEPERATKPDDNQPKCEGCRPEDDYYDRHCPVHGIVAEEDAYWAKVRAEYEARGEGDPPR